MEWEWVREGERGKERDGGGERERGNGSFLSRHRDDSRVNFDKIERETQTDIRETER